MESITFLGLPAELRLRIYEFVCHVDIDSMVLENIEHYCRRGIKARLIAASGRGSLHDKLPWLSLLLTCKTISSELRSTITSSQFLGDEHNKTYVLNLQVYNDLSQPLRQAVWRNIPCQPSQARILEMHIHTLTGSGPWTEGGPASLARAVYQMLNHTCHNGPLIIRRRPLPRHMQLRELIVNVDMGEEMRPPRPACNVDPEYNYADLVKQFRQVAKAGLLFGYVERIKVVDVRGGNGVVDVEVGHRPPAGVPGSWQNYGFYWGV